MDCDKKNKMDTPPPLPPEDPPKAPRPPSPPPSMQASNRDHERLDFENDAGGDQSNTCSGPPAKRPRLGCESHIEDDRFGEDEGPDTLLGSGLAAELLEEGEIFDSASILSRNGSWTSSKSFSTSQERDDSQTTGSPSVIPDVCSSKNEIGNNHDDSVADPIECTKSSSLSDKSGKVAPVNKAKVDQPEKEARSPRQEAPLDEEQIETKVKNESLSYHLMALEQPADGKHSLKPIIPSQGQEEFEVIDDLDSDGEAGGNQSNTDTDSDDMYDEDEIDALLEEEMEKGAPRARQTGEGHAVALEQKEKVVLVDRSNDPFDILPENWVMVTHNSGMPLYLHKKSRVCTLSKPYFLGPSSARKHDIPVSAIPCLQYQRALEKRQDEQQNVVNETCPSQIDSKDQQSTDAARILENSPAPAFVSTNGQYVGKQLDQSETNLPNIGVKIETAKDHEKQNSLGVMEVREYCQKLFQFQTITVKRFKTWKDRRKHTNLLKRVSRPSLPSSTKLIRCAIPAERDSKSMKRKEFVLNPAGKSDICILHEYVQQAMRVQPRYVFEELQNSHTPFGATVVIGGEKYGSGYSSSKKGAKLEAAKQTLSILIPEMTKLKNEDKEEPSTSDLTLFDTIKIEDPRVTELCNKAGQPGPFPVLCECLKRNYGVGDTQVQMEMKAIKHQKSEFIMKVGKHEACVVCKNKREGKQQAAQAILQKMHPHIHTWGSLLRLYDRSIINQCDVTEDAAVGADETKELENNIPCFVTVNINYGKQSKSLLIQTLDVDSQTDLEMIEKCVQTENQNAANEQDMENKKHADSKTYSDNEMQAEDKLCANDKTQVEDKINTEDPKHQLHAIITSEPKRDTNDIKSMGANECEDMDIVLENDDIVSANIRGGGDADETTPWQSKVHKVTIVRDYRIPDNEDDGILNQKWYHRAIQTEWVGKNMFHKTTQYPEILYSAEDKRKITPATVSTISPTVQKDPSKLSSGYKCVEVRSGSGVIYGFTPALPRPIQQVDPNSITKLQSPRSDAAESEASTNTDQSKQEENVPLSGVEMTSTAISNPASTTRQVAMMPAMYTCPTATYPMGYQYPISGYAPGAYAPGAYAPGGYAPGGYMMAYMPQTPYGTTSSQASPTSADMLRWRNP